MALYPRTELGHWQNAMLKAYGGNTPHFEVSDPRTAHEAAGAVWLDLVNPTEDERGLAERAAGLRIPTLAEIEEIETSSRLYSEGDTLYLSTPLASSVDGGSASSPVGFVLSPDRLVTVRFASHPVFDAFVAHPPSDQRPSSIGIFLGLLEAIVDRLADVLEQAGNELDQLSRRVFHADQSHHRRRVNDDAPLRAMLRGIGRIGDLTSNVRDSLLGFARIVRYVSETAASRIPEALHPRFARLDGDISSLNHYDEHLSNKLQFLLDATLGFINIEQNNGIKVLTVVSVVGIPPTLIASIYGMNFKIIPELNWVFGYPYALALMALSAAVPLVWFRRRGWV
jgi:magnesium transporter